MSLFAWVPILGVVIGSMGAHDAPPAVEQSPQEMLAAWDSAPPLRREAIHKALADRAGVVEPWVIDSLRTGTVNERLLACAILERARSAQGEAALIEAFDNLDSRVAAQAMLSVAAFGGPAATEAVRNRLASLAEPRLVKAALAALARLGDATDQSRIAPYLQDPDETVRVNAAAALAQLGDVSGESLLLAATSSENPQARREATYALGFFDSAAAKDRLDAIVAGSGEHWRTEAEMALELIQLRRAASDQERTARLGELAYGPNSELSQWARTQLEALNQALTEPATKHVTDVHGGGVLGNPRRSITANAFELIGTSFYSSRDAEDTAKGTVDEDDGARPINHFYNPVTGLNTMPASRMDAVTRAEKFWNRARLLWLHGPHNGSLGAAHMLGRSMHMLQDMTSPAHVHDDPHVPPLDPDDFEHWGETNYPTPEAILPGLVPYVPQGNVTLPDGRVVSAASPAGLVHNMALFTYEMTAIPGEIIAGDLQPDSELGRMFPGHRIYYQDAGILGANYWQIEEVGPYGLLEKNRWWPCADEFTDDDPGSGAPQHITGRFYIENISGDHWDLVPAVYERPLRHIADPAGMTILDIYARELYPEVVERSAGFLLAFQDSTTSAEGGCTSPAQTGARTVAGDSLLTALAVGVLVFAGRKRARPGR